MFQLFLEGLDAPRQQVFKALQAFKNDFVLAGGTALSLQIGHRVSYDFDLFANKPFPKTLIAKFVRIFGDLKPKLRTDEIILFQTKDKIDVHFVVEEFKNLALPVKTSSLPLLSLDDLAANKTYTIGQRATWRDYVDLFFLLKTNLFKIDRLIGFAKKKFGFEFNERLFVEQLSYFEDVLIVPIAFLKEKYEPEEIQKFLQNETKKYLREKGW